MSMPNASARARSVLSRGLAGVPGFDSPFSSLRYVNVVTSAAAASRSWLNPRSTRSRCNRVPSSRAYLSHAFAGTPVATC